jgi:hypothetical protein
MFEHYLGILNFFLNFDFIIFLSYQPSEIIEKCTEAKDMLERWKQVKLNNFRFVFWEFIFCFFFTVVL